MSLSKLYFSLEGRISRSTYWLKFMLPYIVLYIIAVFLDMQDIQAQMQANPEAFNPAMVVMKYSLIFSLVMLYPSIAVGVKRCHDRNRTGWFLLISLIPLVNLWVLVELWFLKGTTGANNYGEDPLA